MSIRDFQAALESDQTPLFSALRKIREADPVNIDPTKWPEWD